MQFALTILTLAATAVLALPSNPIKTRTECKPATYRCKTDCSGWEVCSTEGIWVYAGSCTGTTKCEPNPVNNLPYCVPPGFSW